MWLECHGHIAARTDAHINHCPAVVGTPDWMGVKGKALQRNRCCGMRIDALPVRLVRAEAKVWSFLSPSGCSSDCMYVSQDD